MSPFLPLTLKPLMRKLLLRRAFGLRGLRGTAVIRLRSSIFNVQVALGWLLVGAAGMTAHAQAPSSSGVDFNRIAPKEPVGGVRSSTLPPVSDNTRALVQKLAGVVFLKELSEVKKEALAVHGIQARGFDLLGTEEFRNQMASFLGKPVDMVVLREIGSLVETTYKKSGRSKVRVMLPPGQNLSQGTLQLVVNEDPQSSSKPSDDLLPR